VNVGEDQQLHEFILCIRLRDFGQACFRVHCLRLRPVRAAIAACLACAALVSSPAPRLYLSSPVDRQAFRRWFAFMAESRYYAHKRVHEITDCAALVQWSFREALIPHDTAWARITDLPIFPSMPSVQEGAWTGEQEEADASDLHHNRTWFVSRDIRSALPGDLLFFEAAGDSAEHVMIYIGASQILPSSRNWVVYLADRGREVEKVTVDSLLSPDYGDWRPRSENPRFLGVWRFNLLRDAP
jgi:uncharacterized protein YfaT (DUF1175 family)